MDIRRFNPITGTMLKTNIKRANRLIEQLDEYTKLVDQLATTTTVTIAIPATESAGQTVVMIIADDDTEIKPFVKNKKAAFIQNLIDHYTTRITEIEAEILTP